MKLTVQEIARYRPPWGKDHIVFDEELPGFGLRYRNGKRTWIYQYAFGSGEDRVSARMTLGEHPALPPAKARSQAVDLYAKVRLGQHPAAEKKESREEYRNTFGRLVSGYLEFKKNEVRPRTYIMLNWCLNKQAGALHSQPASTIDRRRIAELLDTIAKKSGAVSANRTRSVLSAMFSWSIRKGLHDSNPTVGTETRRERSRDRVLSDNELAIVWNALGSGSYSDITRLLILTGQRANEIAHLRWSEIDFDSNVISLPAERCKNGRAHSFPMSEPVREILAARKQSDSRDFVFGRGEGFNGWGKSKARHDARLEKPIPSWVSHDLRRTFATGLQRLGIRLEVTEAILNHASGSRSGVAGIYQRHNWAAEKKAALDAWAAHVLGVVSGKKGESNVTPIRGRA